MRRMRVGHQHGAALALAATGVVVLMLACGGDAGTGPQAGQPPNPPVGTATKVPRLLELSRLDGKTIPLVHFHSADGVHAIETDSGSATLQSDSAVVLRTFGRYGIQDSATSSWRPMSVICTGRLQSSGTASVYGEVCGGTAHVLPDGAIAADLTIHDAGQTQPFGSFTFSKAYTGALYPAPVVTSISPQHVLQNSDSVRLVISGSQFTPATLVTWNSDSTLQVTYVSPTVITALIPGTDLRQMEKALLTVSNPQPGGGGVMLQYSVVYPPPVISSLMPATVPTGGGYFTLHVYGTGFTAGSTILWNGTPRVTFPTSSTELTLDVSNADVQAAGTVQISVTTAPTLDDSLGGGTTTAIPLTITGTPAQKLSEIVVPFAASQLIADPVRPLVYAIAARHETTRPHSVIALDPATGDVVWTLDLGATIAPIRETAAAVSDDGQYLYIGRSADSTVERISLATHTLDSQVIQLGRIGVIGTYEAAELAVAPGHPHTVAVVANGPSTKLVIYDDTVPRSGVVTLSKPPSVIAFTGAQQLTSVSDVGTVASYSVDASGITLLNQLLQALGLGGYGVNGTHIATANGVVYDVNAHAAVTLRGFVPSAGVLPRLDGSRVYAADLRGQNLRAYDPVSNVEIGAVPLTGNSTQGATGSMVRFGSDGLAFTTYYNTYLVRASFVQ